MFGLLLNQIDHYSLMAVVALTNGCCCINKRSATLSTAAGATRYKGGLGRTCVGRLMEGKIGSSTIIPRMGHC